MMQRSKTAQLLDSKWMTKLDRQQTGLWPTFVAVLHTMAIYAHASVYASQLVRMSATRRLTPVPYKRFVATLAVFATLSFGILNWYSQDTPIMQFAAVRHIPQSSLHVSKPTWWLESRFHFSFADYWNDKRMNFGALRVVNDDIVQGKAGFGTHPHRDAEIFSYVLEGQLTHQDSMGNRESLSRGAVQYLSAGSGITHSEMNEHKESCRFIQVWITPDARGHTPQYGSSTYAPADRHNRLLQVLSGTGAAPKWPGLHSPHSIQLHQDVNVVVSETDAGVQHGLELSAGRQAYLLCMEGSLQVNDDLTLSTRDAAEVTGASDSSTQLNLKAGGEGAHFLLIEMKKE